MASFLKLVVTEGPEAGDEFVVSETGAEIGTDPDRDITLHGKAISPRHCRVTLSEGSWIVEDLQSETGTFVNDEPVELRALQEGDVIRIGETRLAVEELRVPPPEEEHPKPPPAVVAGPHAADAEAPFPLSEGTWYYFDGESEHGPYELQTLKQLVWDGGITSATPVREEGMADWCSAREIPALEQSDRLRKRVALADIYGTWKRQARPEKMDFRPFAVCSSAAAVCFVLAAYLGYVQDNDRVATFCGAGGSMLLVVSIAFWAILHYYCWAVLPERAARTSPGKAVGFMFIPWFNLIWAFVSFPGLAADLRRYAARQHIAAGWIPPGIGIALGVLFCVGFFGAGVPIFNVIVGSLCFGAALVFYVTVAKAARAIAAWRIENQV